MISVLILTKNEEKNMPACLASVAWSDDIHVFDSFSEDATVAIAKAAGATVTLRIFDNWAAHQNWAVQHLPFKHKWVLYIDADERVPEGLKKILLAFGGENREEVAFSILRRDYSWSGKWLKHAQMSPFYIRLFCPGKISYRRLVNPVAEVNGKLGKLDGFLDHYPFSKGMRHWWKRHLEYADQEARMRVEDMEEKTSFSLLRALFSRDFHQRRYHQKGIFYKLPNRPLIKFVYLCIWRRGFLDGADGIRYARMQSIYESFIVLRTKALLKKK